ncbi:MAG: hypothetical protein PVI21_04865 [Candidatus Woesebacteria bacterium]|jgi:hypothetical protein
MSPLVSFSYEGIRYVTVNAAAKHKNVHNTIILPNGTLIRPRAWRGNTAADFRTIDTYPQNCTHPAVPAVFSQVNASRRIYGSDIIAVLGELADIANLSNRARAYHNLRAGLVGVTSMHYLGDFWITTSNEDPIVGSAEFTKKVIVVRSALWPSKSNKDNYRQGRLSEIARCQQEQCANLAHILSELLR